MKNFKQEKERFEQFLSKHNIWVTATGSQNDLSARSMSIMYYGSKIYFQTDTGFEKYRHIQENPHIALCCDNFQVKGLARILGHTMAKENAELMVHYQSIHPDSYRRYSNRKNSCLVEVVPERVQIWEYIDGEPYISKIDLVQQTAESIKYE